MTRKYIVRLTEEERFALKVLVSLGKAVCPQNNTRQDITACG